MDKLVRVSHKHLKSLSELYKGASWPLHATTSATLINHSNRIEKFPEFDEKIEVFSLNEDFKDGTFVIKNGPRIFFNTLEPAPYKRLDKALNLVSYQENSIFVAFREIFRPTVLNMLAHRNLDLAYEYNTRCAFVSKETIDMLPDPPLPPGFTIGSLRPEHALEVRDETLNDDEGNLEYVEAIIKYNNSVAVFADTGELASWAFCTDYSTSGTLYTKEKFSNSGCAASVGIEMAKMLEKKYGYMCWHILHSNLKSIRLAEKYLAEFVDNHAWIAIKPREALGYKFVPPVAKYQVIM